MATPRKPPTIPATLVSDTGLPLRENGPAPEATDPLRQQRALDFCIGAARSLESDKCQDVLVLDLRGMSQITDFFVIASGTSDRQMHSAAQHVRDLAEARETALYRSNLDEPRAEWLILDFVDAVVHVFMPETRRYYDLEMLWGDAPRVEWRACPDGGPAGPDRNRAGLKAGDVPPEAGGPRPRAV